MSDHDPDNRGTDPEALYRALPKESPPPELDQKILAHAAARPAQTPPGIRWDVFGRRFAAAAVVVLAVGIFLQTEPPIERLEPQATSNTAERDPAVAISDVMQSEEVMTTSAAPTPAPAHTPAAAEPKRTRMMLEEREQRYAKMRDRPVREEHSNQEISEAALSKTALSSTTTSEISAGTPTSDQPQAQTIEEVIVADTARQLYMADSTLPIALSTEACNEDEPCQTKALHTNCSEAFFVPTEAINIEIDQETLVFTHEDKDHFVRCLEGSWTKQSQDIQ